MNMRDQIGHKLYNVDKSPSLKTSDMGLRSGCDIMASLHHLDI